MEERKSVLLGIGNKEVIPLHKDDSLSGYKYQVIAPIIAKGDAIGSVIILSKDEEIGELELKLAETAATFLGKQMEQ